MSSERLEEEFRARRINVRLLAVIKSNQEYDLSYPRGCHIPLERTVGSEVGSEWHTMSHMCLPCPTLCRVTRLFTSASLDDRVLLRLTERWGFCRLLCEYAARLQIRFETPGTRAALGIVL